MSLFILLFASIGLSLLLLKSLRHRWLDRRLPRWALCVGGPVAWLLVVSCGAWAVETGRLMVEGVQGSVDALMKAGTGLLLAAVGVKLALVADVSPLKDFLFESLLFRNYERHMGGYAAEQAQQIIDAHHRTMGETGNAERLLAPEPPRSRDPEELRAELHTVPLHFRSLDLSHELELLGQGSAVELTDSWRLFWYARGAGEPAEGIIQITLDGKGGELCVHHVRDDVAAHTVRRTLSSVHLKQDLYDLMAGVWNSAWITPYSSFVRVLSVIVYGSTVETFGVPSAQPLVKCSLPIRVFQTSEHGVHDIRDLGLQQLGPPSR